MFKIRMRKIMLSISILTVLFIVYQLSFSESRNDSQRDLVLSKEIDKAYETKFQNLRDGKLRERFSKPNDELPFQSEKTVMNKGPNVFVSTNTPSLFNGEKIVHLDLKGAPPRVLYYQEFFPLIKSFGATGLLIEYEDMFPYSSAVTAANAYSRSDIETILKLASENNLQVIPLVQTFGHLEFVLKLEEFEHLREVPRFPQVICPSRNGTIKFIKSLIDDIIALHPNSKYIHIGCDEVYNLGECNQCLETMLKNNWTKQQLFLSHVTMVARYIKEKYPNVKPLTWDDEFRKMSLQELSASGVGSLVEPVVWKYTTTIDEYLPEELWDKYGTVFGSVWIASAFKGATGVDKFVTDISYHLENHRAWLRLVKAHSQRVVFKGLMMTGWQRYDHFAILCELLPVGLPSLIINLAFLSQNDIDMQSAPQRVLERLRCGPGLLSLQTGSRCNFPGSTVYDKAQQLSTLLDQVRQMEEMSQNKGWLTDYNIQTDFSSPSHVETGTSEVDRFKMELMYLEQDMTRAMGEIFFPDVAREWVLTYISPVHKRLQSMWDAKERLLARKTWPRRPLTTQNEL